MKKRFLSVVLVLTLCSMLTLQILAADSFSNFTVKSAYANQFSDVSPSVWFSKYVQKGFEYGLIRGVSETQFAPDKSLSLAETITLASRLHSIYLTGVEPDSTVPAGGKWYDPYVSYALSKGIIAQVYADYTATATRSEVAVIFVRALPEEALGQARSIVDGTIPDVPMTEIYAPAVYKLYRVGILSGNDAQGTFSPNSNIKRSEIATICIRLVDPSERATTAIGGTAGTKELLTAAQIAEKCAPAVFFIQVYGLNGNERCTGSGFFISNNGLAVTNFHVASNASRIVIKTIDGTTYDASVIDLDEEHDLALLKVDCADVPYLEMDVSGELKQGQQVYAIGSPLGLENTLSQGIISNTSRPIGETSFIQMSVPIAPGSSGGALIDEYGKVIGVASAGFLSAGADLNLAVPVGIVKGMNMTATQSLVCWASDYYPVFFQAMDFGAFSGVKLLTAYAESPTRYTFNYDAFDFTDAENFAYTMYFYSVALEEQGLTHISNNDSFTGRYESKTEIVDVSVDLDNERVIKVSIERKVQHYVEFANLPDFGWYSLTTPKGEPYHIDNAIMYEYVWSDYWYYDDFEMVLFDYFNLLENQGFVFRGQSEGIYLFEGKGLSVVFNVTDRSLHVDVVKI